MANGDLGEAHISFMQWSRSQGVDINGVTPANFPGRGTGMVTTRSIQEGEVMVTVPITAMLTIDSIPSSFIRMYPKGTSIHAILAAYLTQGDSESLKKWDAWRQVWPHRRDFEESMPLLWPKSTSHEALSRFPPSASGSWSSIKKSPASIKYYTRYTSLLPQQEKRLQDAWKDVVKVSPNMDWDMFSYHWLILNTRSFYYVTPGKPEPEDWNDAIALVPFADYFNHDDDAPCDPHFDGSAYTFKASRDFQKGEEVFMSYGSHSNDFLFVEYGFFLEDNKSDAIYLDDIIFRELTMPQKKELRSREFYGNYKVTSSGVCPRTKAVACMKYMSLRQWRDYILGLDHAMDSRKTTDVLDGWINAYLKESVINIKALEEAQTAQQLASQDQEKERLETLLRRWNQIKALCEFALNAIHQ